MIKELKNGDAREVSRIAEQMDKALDEEVGIPHVIGIGSVVGQLKDIARSFKEAQIAVDVGHVFNEDKTVMNFENLGIGRLIYQLPTTLCEMFLSEVFKKGSIDPEAVCPPEYPGLPAGKDQEAHRAGSAGV